MQRTIEPPQWWNRTAWPRDHKTCSNVSSFNYGLGAASAGVSVVLKM